MTEPTSILNTYAFSFHFVLRLYSTLFDYFSFPWFRSLSIVVCLNFPVFSERRLHCLWVSTLRQMYIRRFHGGRCMTTEKPSTRFPSVLLELDNVKEERLPGISALGRNLSNLGSKPSAEIRLTLCYMLGRVDIF